MLRTRVLLLGLVTAAAFLIRPASLAPPARQIAPTSVRSEWQSGFSFWGPSADYASPESLESLRRLRDLGARYVSPLVIWYVDHRWAAEIAPGQRTPSDEAISALAAEARSLGLEIVLSVRVDSRDGAWRAFFQPGDVPGWFVSYQRMVEHYAELAAREGMAGLIIGSENISLTRPEHTPYWADIIAAARQRFSGFLTYGATWGEGEPVYPGDHLQEFTQIQFWPLLDYLGVVGYFELGPHPDPSPDQVRRSWEAWCRQEIAPFQATYGQPLIFTELGYRSVRGTAVHPWDYNLGGPVDLDVQARLYQGFFEFWHDVPWVAGAYFWHWVPSPDAGGPLDDGYTPQNKPATQNIADWFAWLDHMELPAVHEGGDVCAR